MKKAKILLSTALALCMGATAVIPAFASINTFTFTKIGDYNADNKVNVTDVTTLQLQLSGSDVVTGTALEHTDFDGDGIFDVNDISQMQKMVVGAEYNCYKQTGDSYNNIPEETQYYYYDYSGSIPGERINYEIFFQDHNYIVTKNELASIGRCNFLITSTEQFCDLFKAESPEFNDEFFEENALYVFIGIMGTHDYSIIDTIHVDGNQLIVSRMDCSAWPPTNEYDCYNMFVKLKKSDVENVDNIFVNKTYIAEP